MVPDRIEARQPSWAPQPLPLAWMVVTRSLCSSSRPSTTSAGRGGWGRSLQHAQQCEVVGTPYACCKRVAHLYTYFIVGKNLQPAGEPTH